jgi:hypothetical protein
LPSTPGKPLPRGRHGIPTDHVRGNQRQRLTAAMAWCCAGTGYAFLSVSQLVRSAAVSKKTFYLFDGKQDCPIYSYEAYSDQLYARIDRESVWRRIPGPPEAA